MLRRSQPGWLVPLSRTHLLLVCPELYRRDPLWWYRRRTRRGRLRPRAALSFVQSQSSENNGAGTAVTVTISTSPGNLLVCFTCQRANNTSTVAISDTASQTWTQTASGYATQSASDRAAMFFIPNSAALTSVTATWSGGLSTRVDLIVFEISGAATSSAEDSSVNNNQANGTTATSGSLTTTNPDDILVFGVEIGGTYTAPTAGSGYTIPSPSGSAPRSAMEYQIVSSTQAGVTATLTWTTSLSDTNIFAAFKASAASPSTALAGVLQDPASSPQGVTQPVAGGWT